MNAKIIVIDALDGVGKTTTGRLLAERLNGVFWNTPGPRIRNVAPEVLRSLHEHQLARCLFYASSVLSIGEKAKKKKEQGTTVVIDRYWLSTISYARARGVKANLMELEKHIVRPDISIVFELDEYERKQRLMNRGMTLCDKETLNPIFRDTICEEMTKRRTDGLGANLLLNITNLTPDDICIEIVKHLSMLEKS